MLELQKHGASKHDDHVEDTDGLDQVTVEGDSGLDGEEIPGHLDPLLEQ